MIFQKGENKLTRRREEIPERKFILVDVSIKGTRPLLMNDSFEEELTPAKKGKVYDDVEECEKRLIKAKDGTICQKAIHFEAAMVKSATEFKFKGHKTYKDLFKAGVFVEPLLIPHKITKWEIDKQSVVIGRARIPRARPRFDEWELEFQIKCMDDRIEFLVLKQVLENAGFYIGVGDYRPRYGLFDVTKFELIDG